MLRGPKQRVGQCKTCESLAGRKPLSPGPVISAGHFWQIEHIHPSQITGWLVIILKRHAAALHDLTAAEWRELATLQDQACRVMFKLFRRRKEYLMCFAEGDGFQHIHVHLLAKPDDLPDSAKGPRIFSMLGGTQERVIPKREIRSLCEDLKTEFKRMGHGRRAN